MQMKLYYTLMKIVVMSHFWNEMGTVSVNLNNINLDDTKYEKDDPDTIIPIRLLPWHIKLEKRKELK